MPDPLLEIEGIKVIVSQYVPEGKALILGPDTLAVDAASANEIRRQLASMQQSTDRWTPEPSPPPAPVRPRLEPGMVMRRYDSPPASAFFSDTELPNETETVYTVHELGKGLRGLSANMQRLGASMGGAAGAACQFGEAAKRVQEQITNAFRLSPGQLMPDMDSIEAHLTQLRQRQAQAMEDELVQQMLQAEHTAFRAGLAPGTGPDGTTNAHAGKAEDLTLDKLTEAIDQLRCGGQRRARDPVLMWHPGQAQDVLAAQMMREYQGDPFGAEWDRPRDPVLPGPPQLQGCRGDADVKRALEAALPGLWVVQTVHRAGDQCRMVKLQWAHMPGAAPLCYTARIATRREQSTLDVHEYDDLVLHRVWAAAQHLYQRGILVTCGQPDPGPPPQDDRGPLHTIKL